MEQPTAVVRIEFTNAQEPIELTFGRTLNGAFVRALEKPKIYQIAPSFTAQLSRPKAGWYNRQLFQFRRAAIHRLTLDEELGGVTILEQDPANSSWKVIQPRNVDANMRDCMQAAQALSNLRADGISTLEAAAAGFPSKNSMTIELLSGTRYTLVFGNRVPGMPEGRESLFVRTSDTPDRIAAVSIRTLLMIRTAFSR